MSDQDRGTSPSPTTCGEKCSPRRASELVDALLDIAVVEQVNRTSRCACPVYPMLERSSRTPSPGELFVTRLGSSDWYEIHILVRERLRAELVRRSPSHAAEMHVRAARWFEEAGEIAVALDQWITADEPREALRLWRPRPALYDSGREATITRTIAALPATIAGGDLDAAVEFAWSNPW